VDYRNDADGACRLIDDWVSEQTENRIPKLLDRLDASTRLVLVNAIYLKAPWQEPFSKEATVDTHFMRLDGTTVSVPTMSGAAERPYAAGDGWKAVELPYVGGSLAMTIVLPDDMAAFDKRLDAAGFAAITSALKPAMVDLSLPRFKTETKTDLMNVLAALGMPLAMDSDRADFSGITSDERLFITGVVHQANIAVDEDGTEASAATAVVMAAATAAPALSVRVDRPFLFALRDTRTGAILFLGRIVDPSAG
jgi:serpin B